MTCPICGSSFLSMGSLKFWWRDGAYYDEVIGTCPDCGKSFSWIEVYTLDHCESVELVEEE